MKLAAFAVKNEDSLGRLYDGKPKDFRAPFQRDRDRILHSTSFRRLMGKTQVFVAHEGDLFRSRLTHSLEVAQTARTIARELCVNEDLAEVIALAHDLGHPPFGHKGEDVLEEKMLNHGGFDHNAQAIRLVCVLEERYISHKGLNLTWESLEGIAKHNGPVKGQIPWAMKDITLAWDLALDSYASLEAQIAAIADDIAYNHHDIQDGLRSGLISEDEIMDVPIIKKCFDEIDRLYPGAQSKPRRSQALAIWFKTMVEDCLEETRKNLAKLAPQSAIDVRNASRRLVKFSNEFNKELKILRLFLLNKLYRHDNVLEVRDVAERMIAKSFDTAMNDLSLLPRDWVKNIDQSDDTARARLVSDYISGMTDRYLAKNWFLYHQEKLPNE